MNAHRIELEKYFWQWIFGCKDRRRYSRERARCRCMVQRNTCLHLVFGAQWADQEFCFVNNLSELRILTTFYFAKNDHQWVIFIFQKTIKPAEPDRQRFSMLRRWSFAAPPPERGGAPDGQGTGGMNTWLPSTTGCRFLWSLYIAENANHNHIKSSIVHFVRFCDEKADHRSFRVAFWPLQVKKRIWKVNGCVFLSPFD